MLIRILHNSPALCAFLDHLDLSLSQPQRQHVCNLVDTRLVCDGVNTLAALQRQFVACVDPSNMADTLRIAPWSAPAGRGLASARGGGQRAGSGVQDLSDASGWGSEPVQRRVESG